MQTLIGEVIESTSTSFTSGAYELLEAPPFGALVRAQARVEDAAVYGLVYDIRTGSKEPGGRALVRGRTYSGRELYDAEIYHEHPDLAEVLQTEFSAITVGFVEDGRVYSTCRRSRLRFTIASMSAVATSWRASACSPTTSARCCSPTRYPAMSCCRR